jgi:2-C-methyl-D-erythritol 4-phosphate cytidylyltransferase
MYSAIITAAGKGARMNIDMPKQYINLGSLPLLCHSVLSFDSIKEISEIILVIPESDKDFIQNKILPFCKTKKEIKIVFGGKERQYSVYNGLLEIENKKGIVLIHDAARPFITKKMIYACIKKAEEKKAAILATPATDTLKIIENQDVIKKTVKRDKIWLAQTPQAFFYPLILKSHIKAKKEGIYKTDDAALLEYLNEKVYIVKGSRFNIKITTDEDLVWAEAYLSSLLYKDKKYE